jgi:hypothetical protein
MKEQLIEEILARFAEVENGWSVTVDIELEPHRELCNLPQEVSQVSPHEIKLINHDKVIETYFSITEHELNNYATELAEIIMHKIRGYHVEEVMRTEPVDTDGPITYHFFILTKVDDLLRDMLILNTEE